MKKNDGPTSSFVWVVVFATLLVSSLPAQSQLWSDLTPASGPTGAVLGTAPTGGYDVANNRLVVFYPRNLAASGVPHEVWVLTDANAVSGTPAWTQLSPTGAPPESNTKVDAVYDPTSNKLIAYGGCQAFCSPLLDKVHVLSNANGLGGSPAWSESTVTNPVGREGYSADYDSGNNLLIAFGGADAILGSGKNDTRVLSNANGLATPSTWTTLAPTGVLPGVREEHRSTYDQTNNVMTLFGGWQVISATNIVNYPDTWLLTNANNQSGTPTWTQATTGTPSGRARHSMVYESSTNEIYMFGGLSWSNVNQKLTTFGDLWILENANGIGGTPAWFELTQFGADTPGPNHSHLAAIDVANRLMIVYGGSDGPSVHNELWILKFDEMPVSLQSFSVE